MEKTKVEIPLWMWQSLATTKDPNSTTGEWGSYSMDWMLEALRSGNQFFIPTYNKEIHKAFWPLVTAVKKGKTIERMPMYIDSPDVYYIIDTSTPPSAH